MTTKPKTRKAPAAKASTPKPATKATPTEPKREISEISRLVSRWKWLEADQEYRASMAPTNNESERLIAIHNDEQQEIERQLMTLFPESFSDLCKMLDLATDLAAEGCMTENAEEMLRNVRAGLSIVWGDETNAARQEGMENMRKYLRSKTVAVIGVAGDAWAMKEIGCGRL